MFSGLKNVQDMETLKYYKWNHSLFIDLIAITYILVEDTSNMLSTVSIFR